MPPQNLLTLADYLQDHGREVGLPEDLSELRRNYEFNLRAARLSLTQGGFAADLAAALNELSTRYAGGRSGLLYYPAEIPEIQLFVKPFDSVVSKIYRQNYVNNRNFPKPPKGGLLTYESIFEEINDLIRTRITCKYMDGPEYVARGLERFCQTRGYDFESYAMANDRGYYAWHAYVKLPVEFLLDQRVIDKSTFIEVQITTQLAEAITSLTHGLYEEVRETRSSPDDQSWRWKPRTQKFRSAYLGHTLHLLEGVIQTFRDEVFGISEEAEKLIVEPTGSSASLPEAEALMDKSPNPESLQ